MSFWEFAARHPWMVVMLIVLVGGNVIIATLRVLHARGVEVRDDEPPPLNR